ncbi:DUF1320 domain-containing protein [Devosia sp.]|uniref:gp436 family protein n=1 Tax=Devosia sp. TaxID=1871048 RepID=UPI001ACDF9A6|nr:DUF1320 domain-containing protein [Devosia sp.]MBN9335629.1 DUF1320 domain-containing protein [Devosia sp.]
MTYCTQQDLADRYGQIKLVQLTDKTNRPQTTIDTVVVEKAITDAASLINSFLGKRYQLPLTVSPPDVLVTYACQIAWFLLHGDTAGKEHPVRLAYADAMKWLERVSSGLVIIEGAGENVAPAGGGQIQTKGPERIFSRDRLQGF